MFKIGDAQVYAIPELELAESLAVFPAASEEVVPLATKLGQDYFDAGEKTFVSAIRSWAIQLPGQTVVVDTGAGNGKDRPASPRFHRLDTPFLDRLSAVGIQPEAVDLVICTHLHVDHVGWNTRWRDGGWHPTFPNARYVLPRIEVAHWQTGPGALDTNAPARAPFNDSVAPLLDNPRTMLADGVEALAPGLCLVPLPGHSPGMMGVRLDRAGERALFIADALHSPLQVWRPAWNSRYCADPSAAAATRIRVLNEAADTGMLLLAAHVAGSGGFYVVRRDQGFDFTPAS